LKEETIVKTFGKNVLKIMDFFDVHKFSDYLGKERGFYLVALHSGKFDCFLKSVVFVE